MDRIQNSNLYKFIDTVCVIVGFLQIVGFVWGYLTKADTTVLLLIVLVQLVEIIILFFFLYELRCKLSLIETLENNNRGNLISAIQMFLNKDKNANSFKITKATLDVSIANSDKWGENDLCDLNFKWKLECKNNTRKELDKLYFRLATVSATSLNNLNFQAYEIKNLGGGDNERSSMKLDSPHIDDKNNMFIIPLEFKKTKGRDEIFTVETTYTCPNCFIQKQDWLIIAPFNFSRHPLERFEINIQCDNKIITKDKYHVRLYKLLIKSPLHREIEGLSDFSISQNGSFTSGEATVDSKYIYIAEMNKIA